MSERAGEFKQLKWSAVSVHNGLGFGEVE